MSRVLLPLSLRIKRFGALMASNYLDIGDASIRDGGFRGFYASSMSVQADSMPLAIGRSSSWIRCAIHFAVWGFFVVDRQIFFDDGDVFLASRDPFSAGERSEMSWVKVIQIF